MEDGKHPIWAHRAVGVALALRGGAKSPEDLLNPPKRGRPDRSNTYEAAALAWMENNRLASWDPHRRLWRLTRAGRIFLDRLERAAS